MYKRCAHLTGKFTYARYAFYRSVTSVRSATSNSAASDATEQEDQPAEDHVYNKLVPWRTGKELARHLYDNALFENKHMIAINKPNKLARYSYRLPLQLSREDVVPHGGVCLNDALPHLMKMAKTEFLDVTLGVHRDASGIVVLAKSEKFHQRLRGYFKEQVRKDKHYLQTFWALTHGVPVPETRETRLGLQKQKIQDYVMTVLTTVSGREAQRHKGQRPYMRYKTLSKSEEWGCALVQVEPTSTRWDSIEVLLTGQLSPLLGDHVYSHRVSSVMGKRVAVKQTKCPPRIQNLPRQLLYQLNLSRKDALHVPQHLHLRHLVLPKLTGLLDKDVKITAPVPDYFLRTMEWLNIPLPHTE